MTLKLIITIDVEEDNWGRYNETEYRTENIARVPALQEMFDSFGVRPTYLVNYPVATNRTADRIFGRLHREGRCEVGAHCHPWNTPPLSGHNRPEDSMMCNLPSEVLDRKIEFLHETIKRNLGVVPTSFRAGRWALNSDVARSLKRLGYKVDTSITPFVDWSNSHGPDFSDRSPLPYRFSPGDIFGKDPRGAMIEVPATIGYLQKNFRAANYAHKLLRKEFARRLRLNGMLYRLSLVNKVWLSPEVSTGGEMIMLTRRLISVGHSIFNMSFHSPTLMSGLTPFTRDREEEQAFIGRIKEYLAFARDAGMESIRLSDAEGLVR